MNIAVVIVLFNPDLKYLSATLSTLKKYCTRIILVDNSSFSSLSLDYINSFSSCSYHPLHSNMGIAHAQNIGMQLIDRTQFSHILLLDQDSIVTPSLFTAYNNIAQTFFEAGVLEYIVGPSTFDLYTSQMHKRKSSEIRTYCNYSLVNVPHVQSSGSLFPISILKYSPLFDSSLFIDYVDWSFCFKMAKQNISIFQILDVCLGHRLGKGPFLLPILNIPVFNISAPMRYFYQVRNIFYLYSGNVISFSLFFKLLAHQTVRILLTIIFCKDKLKVLRSSLNGLFAGLSWLFGGNIRA